MSRIAIIGAGTLGGTVAHVIASRDLCRCVSLVDDASGVAAGKALDLQQAGPVERFRTRVVSDHGPMATIGADIVILTGPASPDAEWGEEAGLERLRQVARANRRAVVICAGATQTGLVERGVREVGIDRRRLIGSTPEAYRAAIRALVALEVGAPASAVALTLVGRPPDRFVVPWSRATVGSERLEELILPARLARLQGRIAAAWPPGPYALAAAAGSIVRSIATGNGRHPCCCVVMDGELGVRRRALAAPVTLDDMGVAGIHPPSLTARERTALESARVD